MNIKFQLKLTRNVSRITGLTGYRAVIGNFVVDALENRDENTLAGSIHISNSNSKTKTIVVKKNNVSRFFEITFYLETGKAILKMYNDMMGEEAKIATLECKNQDLNLFN